MGIRSMLRKVFGRDREESPATSVPPQTRETPETSTPETPEARVTPEAAARRAADDLVAASFDNPHIPKARTADPEDAVAVPAEQEPEATAAAAEPEADAPEAEAQAEATAPAEPETTVSGDADASELAPEEQTETDPEAPAEREADAAEEPQAEATAPAAEPEAVVVEDDATPTEPETTVTADADTSELAPEEQTETDPEAPAEPEAAVVADDTPPAQPEADAPEEAQAEATAPAEPETAVADDADTSEAAAELEAAVVADDTTASATEREADTADEPQAEAEADAPEAQPVEAQADEVRADAAPAVGAEAVPALSLAAVKAAAPHLADAYKAAGAQLKKQGLTGARAAVYLVVDRSGSMRGYFKDGSVQRLAEQVTALAAHLDETAAVTAVFFSTDIDGTVDLAPADLTPTRVEEINGTLGRLGRTNYHRAVEEVLAHHEKNDPARPALVVFQTDGAPESKTAATQALAEAADRPLHWRFVAWGEEDNKAFDYLRKLDGTPRTTTYFAGLTPVETAHAAFYRGLLAGLEF
ncbi:VWA domain-containing protein [Streptomyces tanashiensis]|uniref:VWA domain-containing protein n=1 Tax=Streptomyces tanashiensis TaxID=67367 RepID=UPI0033F6FA5B